MALQWLGSLGRPSDHLAGSGDEDLIVAWEYESSSPERIAVRWREMHVDAARHALFRELADAGEVFTAITVAILDHKKRERV